MSFSLNFFVSVIFVLVQGRITILLLRRTAGLRSGWARTAAVSAVWALNAFLLIGYLASVPALVSRSGLDGTLGLVWGAVTLIWIAVSTCVLALRSALGVLRKQLGEDVDPTRRRMLNAGGAVLMASPLAVMGYGAFVQRTDFRVRELDVAIPGLPDDLAGLRLLHLSDIHLSVFLSMPEFARVIGAANELRPHVTLVTGDLISSAGDPLDACIRQLAGIRSDAGSFACMGNHERFASAERHAAGAGARAGLPFLRRQARQLRFGSAVLNLAGVDYQPLYEKEHYLEGMERLTAPGALNVLLSHNPDVFPVAAQQGYDLLFAGHTHGGQVSVEILDQHVNPARFFTPYVYGLYRSGAAAAYVTRGIGTIGVPARIGAPPELALVRLRKA